MVEGRCMRCKEQVKMTKPRITMTSKGGYMAKGKCPKHPETTVCAMMSKVNAEKAMESGEAEKDF